MGAVTMGGGCNTCQPSGMMTGPVMGDGMILDGGMIQGGVVDGAVINGGTVVDGTVIQGGTGGTVVGPPTLTPSPAN
jgi:hypothetical protein